jgi:dihydrodipicolinate synthase/N-acetylneuraminate lyase
MTAKSFHGIIPPMITPLLNREKPDFDAIEKLVEHLLTGGVHGIFVLGTTGEGPSLSWNRQRQVIQHTCALVGDRVPVLVGITGPSLYESRALAGFAAERGAKAVVAAAPPYFPLTPTELSGYVEELADNLPLPLFLYNMPSHTKIAFDLETVARCMDIPGVIGLKDSSGTMSYFHRVASLIAKSRPDWSLLVGPEDLLAESVLLGGDGGVCGGANLFPRLYVDLYDAAKRGDLTRVANLQQRVMQVTELYRVGQTPSAVIQAIKTGLSHLNIGDGTLAAPLGVMGMEEREKLWQMIDAIGASC